MVRSHAIRLRPDLDNFHLHLMFVGDLDTGAMAMEKLHVDSFTIVGVTARTSNAKETAGNGAIGGLWARLRKDGLLNQIKNRADTHIIALYSDYESDKDGEYTYTLGSKVTSAKNADRDGGASNGVGKLCDIHSRGRTRRPVGDGSVAGVSGH